MISLDNTTQRPEARAGKTVGMVRLILKQRAEQSTHVIVIEHDELNAWINHAQTHGFSLEAEWIGAMRQGDSAGRVAVVPIPA